MAHMVVVVVAGSGTHGGGVTDSGMLEGYSAGQLYYHKLALDSQYSWLSDCPLEQAMHMYTTMGSPPLPLICTNIHE